MVKKIYLLTILLLVFLLRIPLFSQPLDYDEGTYAFFAFFSQGEKFYPAIPVGRLPGIIFTYRLLDNLFPGNIVAFRIAAALLGILGALGVYQLGRILFNRNVGLFSALVFAFFSSQISTDSPANTEFFMMPFTVFAFYLFWLFLKKDKLIWLMLSGLSAGVAVFYKQVAIFEVALLMFWLLQEKHLFLKRSLVFGAGFLLPIAMSAFYFGFKGELSDFWWQSFASGGAYWRYAWQGGAWWWRLRSTAIFLSQTLWPFLLLAFAGLFQANLFLCLWLLLAFLGAFFSGWFFPHYFVQIIPACSLLGGIFLNKIFAWKKIIVFFLLALMLKNNMIYLLNSEAKETGWPPFYESADYLKGRMAADESFFAWSTTPLPYYLTRKHPPTSFIYYYSFLDYQFMLPTYRGWQFDFEANRQQLMRELTSHPPEYLLVDVNPEQIFDQLFLFQRFSSFISQNYELEKQFGNLLLFRSKKDQETTKEMGSLSIPLELVKRFSAITKIEASENQTEVTFEPMVNPGGVLRQFKVTYSATATIDFTPLSLQILGQDGYDFVGNGTVKPSGVIDLHFRAKGLAKPVSFVRVKSGNKTWNNRHYGVNTRLKIVSQVDIFDLYFEPAAGWQKQKFEVYFIYQDGTVSQATTSWLKDPGFQPAD